MSFRFNYSFREEAPVIIRQLNRTVTETRTYLVPPTRLITGYILREGQLELGRELYNGL